MATVAAAVARLRVGCVSAHGWQMSINPPLCMLVNATDVLFVHGSEGRVRQLSRLLEGRGYRWSFFPMRNLPPAAAMVAVRTVIRPGHVETVLDNALLDEPFTTSFPAPTSACYLGLPAVVGRACTPITINFLKHEGTRSVLAPEILEQIRRERALLPTPHPVAHILSLVVCDQGATIDARLYAGDTSDARTGYTRMIPMETGTGAAVWSVPIAPANAN